MSKTQPFRSSFCGVMKCGIVSRGSMCRRWCYVPGVGSGVGRDLARILAGQTRTALELQPGICSHGGASISSPADLSLALFSFWFWYFWLQILFVWIANLPLRWTRLKHVYLRNEASDKGISSMVGCPLWSAHDFTSLSQWTAPFFLTVVSLLRTYALACMYVWCIFPSLQFFDLALDWN